MYIGLHVKYTIFLSYFNENLNFPETLSKNTRVLKFMKIHPMGAEFFHVGVRTDGQTYVKKLTFTFHNVANTPKN
jgi:hypothetical protein